jgi:hypothetical protein
MSGIEENVAVGTQMIVDHYEEQLAVLRRELDEARDDIQRWQTRCFAAERHMRDRDGDAIECGDICQLETLRAACAMKEATLREIAGLTAQGDNADDAFTIAYAARLAKETLATPSPGLRVATKVNLENAYEVGYRDARAAVIEECAAAVERRWGGDIFKDTIAPIVKFIRALAQEGGK